VCFTAAELRCHIEDGARLKLFTRETAHDLRREVAQRFRQIGALEKSLGDTVVLRRTSLADVIEVDGEFRSIERFP